MYLIGITGGTGCGKTTIIDKIKNDIICKKISFISQDSYYKENSHLTKTQRDLINFDEPDSIDFDLLLKHLKLLSNGKQVNQPIYSFKTHNRTKKIKIIQPKPIIILEGILILSHIEIRKMLNYKFYIEVSEELRIKRRIERDVKERGRKKDEIEVQFHKILNPMHKKYVKPIKKYCDEILINNDINSKCEKNIIKFINHNLKNEI